MADKRSFFQRLFDRDPLVQASDPLLARVEALERTLKAAVREWDDAIDTLTRRAGRANKLQGLAEAVEPVDRAAELNRQILARRSARRTNGQEH